MYNFGGYAKIPFSFDQVFVIINGENKLMIRVFHLWAEMAEVEHAYEV